MSGELVTGTRGTEALAERPARASRGPCQWCARPRPDKTNSACCGLHQWFDSERAKVYSLQAMKELTEAVKKTARRLGFDLVGIVHPGPSDQVSRYKAWLAKGYHAEMGYLSRPHAVEKRADPRVLMREIRSIVAVGLNYYPGDHGERGEQQGKVSRYAWGADYHDVLLDRLGRLATWLEEHLGRDVAYRPYADFGPLMERALAQRAGLGWFGKNTNLIHPDIGSYFFLGELLLDVPLAADVPFRGNRCGTCTACLDACPTGALVAPGVLDARRCISYLTIEHRGGIFEAMRPLVEGWVFGCDVCQEVCPWNQRFASPADPSVFHPSRPMLDLADVMSLTEDGFRARFRETPLWRAGRTGLLRNAAVVLGNLGGPAEVPALEAAADDQDPLVREHAVWALRRISLR